MTNKVKCPKCHKHEVYSEHTVGKNWRIFCMNCGRTTKYHETYPQAKREWEGKV